MRLTSSIILIVIVLLISCSKKEKIIEYNPAYEYPIATFSYSGNDGPAPVTVHFTNYSETINKDSASYEWSFGQYGPVSYEKDPVYTFYNTTNKALSKQVSLTVNDLISGLSQTRTVVLLIQPSK